MQNRNTVYEELPLAVDPLNGRRRVGPTARAHAHDLIARRTRRTSGSRGGEAVHGARYTMLMRSPLAGTRRGHLRMRSAAWALGRLSNERIRAMFAYSLSAIPERIP
jgi:hypothetical protein